MFIKNPRVFTIYIAIVCAVIPITGVQAVIQGAVPLLVHGNIIRHELFFVSLMPAERVLVKSAETDKDQKILVDSSEGDLSNIRRQAFTWTAPQKPGNYTVTVSDDRGRLTQLQMLVMVPASEQVNDHLNGYRIGQYPATALRGLNIYKPPKGFIEINREDTQTYISPNFRLGQFLCKQAGDFPKYIVLRPELVLMLERLAAPLGKNAAVGLHIMSGYRTPFYNASIGNGAYSRHQWGGAADVFIDINPRDGTMDDLNNDGRIDKADADTFFSQVEEMLENHNLVKLVGGLSSYSANSAHGPFLHVDVRGFKARW